VQYPDPKPNCLKISHLDNSLWQEIQTSVFSNAENNWTLSPVSFTDIHRMYPWLSMWRQTLLQRLKDKTIKIWDLRFIYRSLFMV
jgi:hypothetical protein